VKKLLAVVVVALVGASAFAATADAAVWRTIASASDTSSYWTYASLSKETAYGTEALRAKTRGPRGWVEVDADVACYNRSWSRYESRTVGWRYWSSGYRTEVNTHKLPVPVSGGKCDIYLSADGNGGRLQIALQRKP
jgi:hypothetical protein